MDATSNHKGSSPTVHGRKKFTRSVWGPRALVRGSEEVGGWHAMQAATRSDVLEIRPGTGVRVRFGILTQDAACIATTTSESGGAREKGLLLVIA